MQLVCSLLARSNFIYSDPSLVLQAGEKQYKSLRDETTRKGSSVLLTWDARRNIRIGSRLGTSYPDDNIQQKGRKTEFKDRFSVGYILCRPHTTGTQGGIEILLATPKNPMLPNYCQKNIPNCV